jgi:hypothetical protein
MLECLDKSNATLLFPVVSMIGAIIVAPFFLYIGWLAGKAAAKWTEKK